MKKIRIATFEYLRVCAILLVVVCHWMQGLGNLLGFVCGSVGNCLFFLMSGWLLGEHWRKNGCESYSGKFLLHRISRIYPAFFLFVSIYVVILIAHNVKLSGYIWGVGVALNFLMLSWFAKLPGAGHLWFVTGIMILYFTLVLVSRFGVQFRRHGLRVVVGTIFACVLAQMMMQMLGIRQGYLVTLVAVSVVMFLYGDIIGGFVLDAYRKKGKIVLSVLSLVCVGSVCVVMSYDVESMSNSLTSAYWISMLAALSLLLIALMVVGKDKMSGIVTTFLSGISFEIYLVHFPLCMQSPLFLRKWIDNTIVYSAFFAACAVLGAYMLNRLSCRVRKLFWK